jgi:aldehyde:ferredoxin oxidoreductase
MAKKIGRGAEYWSKNIKGAEVIADTRLSYEVTLAQGVSPRGACHLKGLSLFLIYEPLKEYLPPEFLETMQKMYKSPFPIKPFDHRWTPYATRYLIHLMSTVDSLGICAFGSHFMLLHGLMLEDFPPLIEAATGISFSAKELERCAERNRIIQRSFNHRIGLDRKDDYPPQHTFEYPLKAGFHGEPVEIVLDKDKYEEALTEIYNLFGYDPTTGVPTRKTLKTLGLQYIAEDLEKAGILSH